MKRLDVFLLAGIASVLTGEPALAQHQGHTMPEMNMPAKKPTPKKAAPKKPTSKKTAARKAAPKKASSMKAATARASAKAVPRKKGPVKAKPPARSEGESMPDMDMSPGHDMSQMPDSRAPASAGPHDGHDMSNTPVERETPAPEGTDLPAGNMPAPPAPADHAADSTYGPEQMEMGRHHLRAFHGGQKNSQLVFNLAEYQLRKGRDSFSWDAEAWYGGDIDRLWLKSKGDGAFGRSLDHAELQALFSRAVGPYFNLQAGLRVDPKAGASRVYATIGTEGLTPGFFDVEGALFLSNKGELLARAEGYYDQRITQRLILQPRVELNFAAQNSRDLGVGAGLSDAEIGVRLRYDIRREFSPYLGINYLRSFGSTRKFRRDSGEEDGALTFVAGVRTWF